MRWPLRATIGLHVGLWACHAGTATPPPPAPTPSVRVAPARLAADQEQVEAVGRMDGYINAEIRARVRGYIKDQRFHEGSVVDANQVLYTLDAREFEAAVIEARGNVQRAQSALVKAEATLRRTRPLAERQAASGQDLDNAVAAELDAKGQLASAQGALDTALLNLTYTEVRSPIAGLVGISRVRVGNLVGQDGPTLLTTVSQVDPVRVVFSIAEADYLRSPEAMRLSRERRDLAWALAQLARLNPEAGRAAADKVVAAGVGGALGSLDAQGKADAKRAVANAQGVGAAREASGALGAKAAGGVDAAAAKAAKDPGEPTDAAGLTLTLADGQTYAHSGVLITIDREIEASTGTIQLQALFPNPNNVLRPGAFGRVHVPREGGPRQVLVVPAQAVRESQGRATLNVVGEGENVEVRLVELGGLQGGLRVVRSGLKEGERIVVEGGQKVRPGDKVAAEAYVPPAAAAASDAAPASHAVPAARAGATRP